MHNVKSGFHDHTSQSVMFEAAKRSIVICAARDDVTIEKAGSPTDKEGDNSQPLAPIRSFFLRMIALQGSEQYGCKSRESVGPLCHPWG
ncbi:MAG TPA: hypothetical protein DCZ95_00295 [Verrucomicrobia bacterium]|nr:MAG: hypothetical protein A2X46_15080 [Lentisphaerae bacterium GWF2_57_35]HBA82508.1 hypothetical protein [Verrucomicrobiota bacterium]